MGFLLDLRYALRLLAKSPKFTVLTSFILMGGLAVSLMSFNFVHTMALKPLDTPEGDSLLTFYVKGQYPQDQIYAKDWQALDKDLLDEAYAEHAFVYNESARLSVEDTGMNARVAHVSSSFFDLTRFAPALGRGFDEDNHLPHKNNVIVISYRVWQMMFAGEPSVLGHTVKIDNRPYEIIGVMPEGYRFPVNADLWLPINQAFWSSEQAKSTEVGILARLTPGVAIEEADSQFSEAFLQIAQAYLSTSERAAFESMEIKHMSLPQRHMEGAASEMFIGLQSIALAILLMAGINTGNLLFARSIERQKESAIRAALGAKNSRLIRQLVCEGGLLTVIGGFLAILLSGWLLDVLSKIMLQNSGGYLPFWFVWQLDWQTVLVALFFMLLTFAFACLIPAVKAVKMDINAVLRDGTRGALGRGAGKTSTILVTVQVSLIAILMLAGSLGVVLMFKMVNLLDDLPQQNRFGAEFVIDSGEPEALVNNLLTKVGALPQIREVGLMQPTMPANIRLSSGALGAQVDVLLSGGNIGLFNAKVTKGRQIDSRDDSNNERVAMVSQSFVQRHWPAMDPIGQIIDIELNGLLTPHVVVGVVEDQIGNSQAVFAQKHEYDEIYISFFQSPANQFEFTFVTTDEVERAKEAFFSVLYQLDAKSMLVDFEDREGAVNSVMKVTKLITYIVLYSGLFALFLALMGVFGVAASAVALRRQEVGVRRAIGAKDKAIIALFLKRNMKPLSIGLAVGLVVYTLICYLFSTMVGNRIEMGTYISIAVITSLLLSLILSLAAYFPTRAAIAKEPFETLRAD